MGRDCQRLDYSHGRGGDGAISSSKSKSKANGCMAAFYHLFDFQHFYFHSHHHLTIDTPSRSKGIYASFFSHSLSCICLVTEILKCCSCCHCEILGLKLIEESLPSITYKDKQSLNIPVSFLKWIIF